MSGKIIVLDGMDGSGTTTQSRMLASFLEGFNYRVVHSAEPTKSPLGLEARRLLQQPIAHEQNLLTCLALCFAADRMHHVHHVIAPAIKSQDFIILDRYVLSSLVYQGLHLPSAFVKEVNRYAPKPDLTFVLDIDVKAAEERLAMRLAHKDFYESKALLEQIRSRYIHFAEEDSKNTIIVDAEDSIEQVHSHIVHALRDRIL